MAVQRDDLTDTGAGGQLIAVLMGGTGRDIDSDDAHQVAFLAVLNGRRLQDADECLTVWGNRQPFHPLVIGSAAGIAGNLVLLLVLADWALVRDIDIACGNWSARSRCEAGVARQGEAGDALTGRPVELIHVRSVFIGDEDALSIGRNADRFGI